MAAVKYDVRMPEFHRLAIIMAESRDLFESLDGSDPKAPAGMTGKKCPECQSLRYAKCAMTGCGFSICLDCRHTEHPERAFAKHR